MGYRHGIYISELATSITPPVQVSAGLIVVLAPLFPDRSCILS